MDSSQKSPDQATQELEGGSTQVPNWQIITAFVFGALFLTAILVLVVLIPNPKPVQFLVFRIVISLAAAGIVGVFSGYLHVQGQIAKWAIRGGGAFAVFLVVYFFSPTLVDASAVRQECTGDNCEQNVTVNNNYGITPEDYEKALKKREQEVTDRLTKTDHPDRLVRCSASEDLKGANVNIRFGVEDKRKLVAQMVDIIINKNGKARSEKYIDTDLRNTIFFASNLDKQACLLNKLLFDSKYKLKQGSSWIDNDNIAIYLQ